MHSIKCSFEMSINLVLRVYDNSKPKDMFINLQIRTLIEYHMFLTFWLHHTICHIRLVLSPSLCGIGYESLQTTQMWIEINIEIVQCRTVNILFVPNACCNRHRNKLIQRKTHHLTIIHNSHDTLAIWIWENWVNFAPNIYIS